MWSDSQISSTKPLTLNSSRSQSSEVGSIAEGKRQFAVFEFADEAGLLVSNPRP